MGLSLHGYGFAALKRDLRASLIGRQFQFAFGGSSR